VPGSKLGSSDSNRAGSVQSDISFNRESVGPRLTLWDEELTLGICSTFDERLQFKHENPIPRDRQLEVAEAKTYLAGLPTMTINEFRKEVLNLSPITGGEKFYIPNKYIDIEDVDKVTNANIVSATRPAGTPNTGSDGRPAPDGSDSRDDNPTPGRSISGQGWIKTVIIEAKIRKVLPEMLQAIFSDNRKELPSWEVYGAEVDQVIDTMIDAFEEEFYEKNSGVEYEDAWPITFGGDVTRMLHETLAKNWKGDTQWNDHVAEMFNSNPRISKICNAIIRSTVNFVRYNWFKSQNLPMVWTVNRNECGHKGRIKEKKSFDTFKLGIHDIRFPGEKLSLYCDCELDKGE
jgi:hypothetical protein